jgi:phospholipase C
MIVISPWSTGGWVCSQVFDHTSVLQFLEARFNVPAPHITAWRRSLCGDLTAAFDFSARPNVSVRNFQVPELLNSPPQPYPYHLDVEYSMPKQEPGTRRARAIPYEFVVHARLQDNKTQAIQQKVWLDFANTGKAGAAFYVYDKKRLESNPRRYTVAAKDAFSDYWPTSDTHGAYDLIVHGPNGSMYQFQGNTVEAASKGKSNPEVKLIYDAVRRNVTLSLTNSGSFPCTLKVVNAYDRNAPRVHSVAAGATIQDRWVLKSSSGWFDLSVTSTEAPTFLRRFAGHVESQRPSTSDPGIFKEDT